MTGRRIQSGSRVSSGGSGGYALLLTLLLLLIAGGAMAAVAYQSLAQTVLAGSLQDDLQRRWGTRSLLTFCLPKSEQFFAAAEQTTLAGSGPNPIVLRQDPTRKAALSTSVTLGGQQFELIFGDEQAKVNINALAQRLAPADLARALETFLSNRPPGREIHLRPLLAASAGSDPAKSSGLGLSGAFPGALPGLIPGADKKMPAYGGFDQVFTGASPQDLLPGGEAAGQLTAELTLWGDGKLNFRRASDRALNLVLGSVLDTSVAAQVTDFRQQFPGGDTGQLLRQLPLNETQRSATVPLLTGRSSCYSLWVVCRPAAAGSSTGSGVTSGGGGGGERSWYTLAVWESGQSGKPQIHRLVW